MNSFASSDQNDFDRLAATGGQITRSINNVHNDLSETNGLIRSGFTKAGGVLSSIKNGISNVGQGIANVYNSNKENYGIDTQEFSKRVAAMAGGPIGVAVRDVLASSGASIGNVVKKSIGGIANIFHGHGKDSQILDNNLNQLNTLNNRQLRAENEQTEAIKDGNKILGELRNIARTGGGSASLTPSKGATKSYDSHTGALISNGSGPSEVIDLLRQIAQNQAGLKNVFTDPEGKESGGVFRTIIKDMISMPFGFKYWFSGRYAKDIKRDPNPMVTIVNALIKMYEWERIGIDLSRRQLNELIKAAGGQEQKYMGHEGAMVAAVKRASGAIKSGTIKTFGNNAFGRFMGKALSLPISFLRFGENDFEDSQYLKGYSVGAGVGRSRKKGLGGLWENLTGGDAEFQKQLYSERNTRRVMDTLLGGDFDNSELGTRTSRLIKKLRIEDDVKIQRMLKDNVLSEMLAKLNEMKTSNTFTDDQIKQHGVDLKRHLIEIISTYGLDGVHGNRVDINPLVKKIKNKESLFDLSEGTITARDLFGDLGDAESRRKSNEEFLAEQERIINDPKSSRSDIQSAYQNLHAFARRLEEEKNTPQLAGGGIIDFIRKKFYKKEENEGAEVIDNKTQKPIANIGEKGPEVVLPFNNSPEGISTLKKLGGIISKYVFPSTTANTSLSDYLGKNSISAPQELFSKIFEPILGSTVPLQLGFNGKFDVVPTYPIAKSTSPLNDSEYSVSVNGQPLEVWKNEEADSTTGKITPVALVAPSQQAISQMIKNNQGLLFKDNFKGSKFGGKYGQEEIIDNGEQKTELKEILNKLDPTASSVANDGSKNAQEILNEEETNQTELLKKVYTLLEKGLNVKGLDKDKKEGLFDSLTGLPGKAMGLLGAFGVGTTSLLALGKKLGKVVVAAGGFIEGLDLGSRTFKSIKDKVGNWWNNIFGAGGENVGESTAAPIVTAAGKITTSAGKFIQEANSNLKPRKLPDAEAIKSQIETQQVKVKNAQEKLNKSQERLDKAIKKNPDVNSNQVKQLQKELNAAKDAHAKELAKLEQAQKTTLEPKPNAETKPTTSSNEPKPTAPKKPDTTPKKPKSSGSKPKPGHKKDLYKERIDRSKLNTPPKAPVQTSPKPVETSLDSWGQAVKDAKTSEARLSRIQSQYDKLSADLTHKTRAGYAYWRRSLQANRAQNKLASLNKDLNRSQSFIGRSWHNIKKPFNYALSIPGDYLGEGIKWGGRGLYVAGGYYGTKHLLNELGTRSGQSTRWDNTAVQMPLLFTPYAGWSIPLSVNSTLGDLSEQFLSGHGFSDPQIARMLGDDITSVLNKDALPTVAKLTSGVGKGVEWVGKSLTKPGIALQSKAGIKLMQGGSKALANTQGILGLGIEGSGSLVKSAGKGLQISAAKAMPFINFYNGITESHDTYKRFRSGDNTGAVLSGIGATGSFVAGVAGIAALKAAAASAAGAAAGSSWAGPVAIAAGTVSILASLIKICWDAHKQDFIESHQYKIDDILGDIQYYEDPETKKFFRNLSIDLDPMEKMERIIKHNRKYRTEKRLWHPQLRTMMWKFDGSFLQKNKEQLKKIIEYNSIEKINAIHQFENSLTEHERTADNANEKLNAMIAQIEKAYTTACNIKIYKYYAGWQLTIFNNLDPKLVLRQCEIASNNKKLEQFVDERGGDRVDKRIVAIIKLEYKRDNEDGNFAKFNLYWMQRYYELIHGKDAKENSKLVDAVNEEFKEIRKEYGTKRGKYRKYITDVTNLHKKMYDLYDDHNSKSKNELIKAVSEGRITIPEIKGILNQYKESGLNWNTFIENNKTNPTITKLASIVSSIKDDEWQEFINGNKKSDNSFVNKISNMLSPLYDNTLDKGMNDIVELYNTLAQIDVVDKKFYEALSADNNFDDNSKLTVAKLYEDRKKSFYTRDYSNSYIPLYDEIKKKVSTWDFGFQKEPKIYKDRKDLFDSLTKQLNPKTEVEKSEESTVVNTPKQKGVSVIAKAYGDTDNKPNIFENADYIDVFKDDGTPERIFKSDYVVLNERVRGITPSGRRFEIAEKGQEVVDHGRIIPTGNNYEAKIAQARLNKVENDTLNSEYLHFAEGTPPVVNASTRIEKEQLDTSKDIRKLLKDIRGNVNSGFEKTKEFYGKTTNYLKTNNTLNSIAGVFNGAVKEIGSTIDSRLKNIRSKNDLEDIEGRAVSETLEQYANGVLQSMDPKSLGVDKAEWMTLTSEQQIAKIYENSEEFKALSDEEKKNKKYQLNDKQIIQILGLNGKLDEKKKEITEFVDFQKKSESNYKAKRSKFTQAQENYKKYKEKLDSYKGKLSELKKPEKTSKPLSAPTPADVVLQEMADELGGIQEPINIADKINDELIAVYNAGKLPSQTKQPIIPINKIITAPTPENKNKSNTSKKSTETSIPENKNESGTSKESTEPNIPPARLVNSQISKDSISYEDEIVPKFFMDISKGKKTTVSDNELAQIRDSLLNGERKPQNIRFKLRVYAKALGYRKVSYDDAKSSMRKILTQLNIKNGGAYLAQTKKLFEKEYKETYNKSNKNLEKTDIPTGNNKSTPVNTVMNAVESVTAPEKKETSKPVSSSPQQAAEQVINSAPESKEFKDGVPQQIDSKINPDIVNLFEGAFLAREKDLNEGLNPPDVGSNSVKYIESVKKSGILKKIMGKNFRKQYDLESAIRDITYGFTDGWNIKKEWEDCYTQAKKNAKNKIKKQNSSSVSVKPIGNNKKPEPAKPTVPTVANSVPKKEEILSDKATKQLEELRRQFGFAENERQQKEIEAKKAAIYASLEKQYSNPKYSDKSQEKQLEFLASYGYQMPTQTGKHFKDNISFQSYDPTAGVMSEQDLTPEALQKAHSEFLYNISNSSRITDPEIIKKYSDPSYIKEWLKSEEAKKIGFLQYHLQPETETFHAETNGQTTASLWTPAVHRYPSQNLILMEAYKNMLMSAVREQDVKDKEFNDLARKNPSDHRVQKKLDLYKEKEKKEQEEKRLSEERFKEYVKSQGVNLSELQKQVDAEKEAKNEALREKYKNIPGFVVIDDDFADGGYEGFSDKPILEKHADGSQTLSSEAGMEAKINLDKMNDGGAAFIPMNDQHTNMMKSLQNYIAEGIANDGVVPGDKSYKSGTTYSTDSNSEPMKRKLANDLLAKSRSKFADGGTNLKLSGDLNTKEHNQFLKNTFTILRDKNLSNKDLSILNFKVTENNSKYNPFFHSDSDILPGGKYFSPAGYPSYVIKAFKEKLHGDTPTKRFMFNIFRERIWELQNKGLNPDEIYIQLVNDFTSEDALRHLFHRWGNFDESLSYIEDGIWRYWAKKRLSEKAKELGLDPTEVISNVAVGTGRRGLYENIQTILDYKKNNITDLKFDGRRGYYIDEKPRKSIKYFNDGGISNIEDKITPLATGGIVKQPIIGEKGQEAVIPFNNSPESKQTMMELGGVISDNIQNSVVQDINDYSKSSKGAILKLAGETYILDTNAGKMGTEQIIDGLRESSANIANSNSTLIYKIAKGGSSSNVVNNITYNDPNIDYRIAEGSPAQIRA